MKDNLLTNYEEWGMCGRKWRRGSEKVSDSEDPVDVEPQSRQRINKDADVVQGLLSDEEEEVEEMSEVPVRRSKKEIDNETREEPREDFRKNFGNYVRHSDTIDWKRVPGVTVPTVPEDCDMTWKDLWKTYMGVVMRDYFCKDDVDGTKYAHLRKMTVASKGIMGSLMVSSFCECINSCANLV